MDEMTRLGSAPPSGIGEILVSCRAFAEYRAMFALTERDLELELLDCPGGAAEFTAVTGGRACDPLYGLAPDALLARAAADRRRAESYVQAHPEEYEWSFFAGLDDYRAQRDAALAAFAHDYATHPERYVEASLPELPFADEAFGLALCSHLLFAFADRLDLAFHVAAIAELTRVASREARIYPVFAMGSRPSLDLAPLRAELAARGIGAELVGVDYRFQRGEPVMLVCRRLNRSAP
jgi:hypothetical protein